MAGIDKMYWSLEQSDEFYEWCKKHFKLTKVEIDILESITINNDLTVTTNFSTKTDRYLQKHCNLDFIQKRLKEQYGNTTRSIF